MNEKKQTNIEDTTFFKPAVILLVLGLILFFSLDKPLFSESEDSSPFLLGWFLVGIVTLIIHVYIVRWAFKINDIVSNQETTNKLLESINNSILNGKQPTDEPSDVNDPNYLKTVIDKLK